MPSSISPVPSAHTLNPAMKYLWGLLALSLKKGGSKAIVYAEVISLVSLKV